VFSEALQRPLLSGFAYGSWPVLKPIDGGKDVVLTSMHWELIPSFIHTWTELDHFRHGGLNPKTGRKDLPRNTLNAIGEEMLDKVSYRQAALHRRCLVLSSGFYEWRHYTAPGMKKDKAYPYRIVLPDREYFFIAGIWQPWADRETGEAMDTFTMKAYPYRIVLPDREYFFIAGIWQPWADCETGEAMDTFTMVTTAANTLMQQVHNRRKRMPLILNDDLAWEWIQDGLPAERIRTMVTYQYPSEQMHAYTIRKDFREASDPTEPFEYAELPAVAD